MADTLRDMVVSLSLNSENFSANIKSINAQLKEADSAFNLAASGVQGFENSAAGTAAKVDNLKQKLDLQKQAVQQYEAALQKAQQKLQSSVDAHDKLSAKLETAKQRHGELGDRVNQLTSELAEMREEGLEGTSAYAEMAAELQDLQDEYKGTGEEVQRLEQQLTRNQAAMQRNADGVTRAQTNLNNAQAAARQTESELRRLTDTCARVGSAMQDMGGKIEKVGKGMTEAGEKASKVSAAVVALGAACVKTFASYDDAIREVYATMGLSEETGAAEMEALDAAAQKMGATTRYSASEAAGALNYLALAGYDAEKAIETLPVVLNLAQAGGIDLASASDMVTDSMSALGISTDQVTGFTDEMAKTAQKSNTSIAQLGEGILKVSGTAKNLAGGTVELNTALGILADNGIKGAEGGTHLRNMILSLQNPTTDAQKLLTSLGVSVYDASGNMRSMQDIFQDLNTAMAGMNQAAKDNVISTVFNKTDLNAANALLANCGDRWNELSGYIENAGGTAAEMGAMMEGGIGGAFRSLKSAVEGLAISFGETLAPTIQAIAQKVTEITAKFAALDEGQKQTIIRIAAIVAAAGPALLIAGKATTAIGTVIKTAGKLVSVFPKIVSAVSTLGKGFVAAGTAIKGFLMSAGGVVTVIAAAVVAIGVGIYKLHDWASGAKAAREAQERLNKTIEDWGENAETSFEKAKGLASFGLSTENFKIGAPDTSEVSSWLEQTIATWTDGKVETDEIVQETVKGFTDGSDRIRNAIQEMQSGTDGSVVGDMSADLESLDAIDKEVESILKKKQNGYLSEDETKRLQELLDQRDAIAVKYKLVGDLNESFDEITTGVQAALARGMSAGDVWSEAFTALAQGKQAALDSINSEYDAKFKEIMANGGDADALSALDAWYNGQVEAIDEAYGKSLQETSQLTQEMWHTADKDGGYNDTINQLRGMADAWNALANTKTGTKEANDAQAAFMDSIDGLDETKILEMIASLTAMKDAGVQLTDEQANLLSFFETMGTATAEDKFSNWGEQFAGLQESMDALFGNGVTEELLEINATLGTTYLDSAFTEWANAEHEPVKAHADSTTFAEDLNGTTVTGLTGEISLYKEDGTPNTDGLKKLKKMEGKITGYVEGLGNVTVDQSSINELEGTVTVYDDKGNAKTVKLSEIKNLEGEVTAYNDDGTASTLNLTSKDGLTGTVVAYEEKLDEDPDFSKLKGLKGIVTAVDDGGKEIKVDLSTLDALKGTVTVVDEDGEAIGEIEISKLKSLQGTVIAVNDKGEETEVTIAQLSELEAYISRIYTDENTEFPEITINSTNYQHGAANTNEGQTDYGVGGLGLNVPEETVNQLNECAAAIDNIRDKSEKAELSGSDMWDAEIDGSKTAANFYNEMLASTAQVGSNVYPIAEYIQGGLAALEDGSLEGEAREKFLSFMADFMTVTGSMDADNPFKETISQQLSEMGMEDINAENLTSALGEKLGEIGVEVSGDLDDGMAKGLTSYSWDPATGIVARSVETSLRQSVDSNSPSKMTMPIGEDISAGMGVGMEKYDFSSHTSTVASKISSAMSGANLYSSLWAVGTNAMAGFAYGIRTGASSVVSEIRDAARKAVQAAKDELVIKSPSHIFRDEIGAMTMKGFGEGVLQEADRQAKIIRNAARYLTGEAQDGVVSANSLDNRRTYNQQSTVNLTVGSMQVRSEKDIKELAIEIASLTKRRQSLQGA